MRNFLKLMDDAYDLGVSDYKKGIKKCPFEVDSAEENQWICGQNDAKKDEKKDSKEKV